MVVRIGWGMSTGRIWIVVVIVVMLGDVAVMTVRGGSGAVKSAEARGAPRRVEIMECGKRIARGERVGRRLWCEGVMAYR